MLADADELQESVDMTPLCLSETCPFGAARVVSRVRRSYDRLTVDHAPRERPLVELHDTVATP